MAAQGRPEPDRADLVEIGRIRFVSLPEARITSRGQSIYRVDVEAVIGSEATVMDDWNNRVARLESRPGPPDAESSIIRKFRGPRGSFALWRHRDANQPALVSLLVFCPMGDHALMLERGCSVEAMADVERLVSLMVDAYVPGRSTGFSVGPGSFISPMGDNESVHLTIRHERFPDVEVFLGSQTTEVAASVDGDPLESVPHQVTVDRRRTVAGLEGREMSVQVDDEGVSTLQTFWRFGGEARDALSPEMTISATCDAPQRDIAAGLYEQILGSLHIAR